MFHFLYENLGTIVILCMVAGMIVGAVLVLRKDRKNGKSACGGQCCNCPHAQHCQQHPSDDKPN